MILKINETCKDASITANSASVNYPVSNLVDSRLTRVFKTSSNTTAEVVFDAGSAVDVTSVVIANHNISAGVTTLKLQGNSSDSWSSPAFETSLTHNSGIIYKDFAKETYRYWRIQIIDASNSDGYIEIGRAWIGENFTTPAISPTVSHSRMSSSVKSISISGQSYMDTRYFYSTISVSFPKITHTEKANLITQFETIDIGKPFFVTFDESKIDLDTYYVTFDVNQLAFEILRNPNYYRGAMSFIEEVR